MKTDATDRALAEMLTECTGAHFLDSGCFLGRNWEHNQGKTVQTFENEPYARYRAEVNDATLEVIGALSVFHYRRDNLEYDARMTRIYHAFDALHPKLSYTDTAEMWAEKIDPGSGHWINSYNGECDLSQGIQFLPFEVKGRPYVALQIHGGCDVRGGYTKPRIFRDLDMLGAAWDLNRVECMVCGFEHERWTKPIPAIELDIPPEPFVQTFHPDLFEPDPTPLPNTYPYKGVAVVVDEVAYCPCCGNEMVVV